MSPIEDWVGVFGRMAPRKLFVRLAPLLAAAFLSACEETTAPPTKTGPAVASVVVSPSSKSLTVGDTVRLLATLKDSAGNVLTGRTVIWSSSNTAAATVSATGLVTAVAAGTVAVTATSDGRTGAAAIGVTPVSVATVTVVPGNRTLVVRDTLRLTATVRDSAGKILTGRTVTWGSSDTAVATVNASGLLTAAAPGTAAITATAEGKSGAAVITVSQVPVAVVTVSPSTTSLSIGAAVQLSATLKDSAGGVLTGRTVTWASANTAVASVSAIGIATAVAVGTTAVTATSEGESGAAVIIVTLVPVAFVLVVPSTQSLAIGDTVRLFATLKDSAGTVLTGRAVIWASSNAAVATVDATGLVSAVAPGTAAVAATSEGKSGVAIISVTDVPVASVTITPTIKNVSIGDTVRLVATLKDAAGNVLTGRTVTWTSSSPTVATVNTTGLVTGVAPGTAAITATSEGKSGVAVMTVLVPVASVTIAPSAKSLIVDDTVRVSATLKDSAGNVLTGRSVTWLSSNAAVATVNAAGLVTALGAGLDTITATAEGRSAKGVITVIAFTRISAGISHSCALTTSGSIYCWGNNVDGRLGNGTTTSSLTPVLVSGGLTFALVSAGGFHTCGVTANGAAACWGYWGQLGTGSTASSTTPVAVAGSVSYQSVTTGTYHSCGVTSSSGGYCWGGNVDGQLGDGTTTTRLTPVVVSAGLSFASMAAGGGVVNGGGHTCALTGGGVAYCWGYNAFGQLGTGSTTNSATPLAVSGGLSLAAISSGFGHTCGLTSGGAAYCWGYNGDGELGSGTTTQSLVPVPVTGSLSFASVSAGANQTCGLTSSGAAYCWGYNGQGALGNGGVSLVSTSPVAVLGGLSFTSMSSGFNHVCAIATRGAAYCWGSGANGRLGTGDTTTKNMPARVLSP